MDKSKKVYIETHGCQMNVSDSERVASSLADDGYEISTSPADADVVILNTCSIRERAEQKLYNRVGEILSSNVGGGKKIGVMGCVAQLEQENIFKRAQGIDFVVGTNATGRIADVVGNVLRGGTKVTELEGNSEASLAPLNTEAHTSEHVAFVPIIVGCNKFCSYCIVPYSRGREKSRVAADVVAEVVALRRAGYKEVQLIGQNVNSYRPKAETGLEPFEGATPFARLLRAVASTGIERVKFTTSFPRDFHTDIVAAMDAHTNLCNWVHLPVQSGSDAVLRKMRRGYKVSDYLQRVDAIRRSRREIALTTDIIVGFPGETDADFTETLALIRECSFHGAYIFKYSERAGTHAARLADDVSPAEKARRFSEVEKLQYEIQHKVYESYVGRILYVLVRGRSARGESDYVGHSTCNKVVNFGSRQDLTGQIVRVRITAAKKNSLYGELAA